MAMVSTAAASDQLQIGQRWQQFRVFVELIRVGEGSNTFIGIEYLTQEEVDEFRARCEAAAKAGIRAVDEANRKAKRAAENAV